MTAQVREFHHPPFLAKIKEEEIKNHMLFSNSRSLNIFQSEFFKIASVTGKTPTRLRQFSMLLKMLPLICSQWIWNISGEKEILQTSMPLHRQMLTPPPKKKKANETCNLYQIYHMSYCDTRLKRAYDNLCGLSVCTLSSEASRTKQLNKHQHHKPNLKFNAWRTTAKEI